MGSLSRGRIMVHSPYLGSGEEAADLLLETLRSDADTAEPVPVAIGAVAGRFHSVIAVVALEGEILVMVREGHAAVWAFKGEAAIRAEDEIGKSPPIEKEEALLLLFNILLEGAS